jgi:lipopolysaccharide transport system ATP-binding protein
MSSEDPHSVTVSNLRKTFRFYRHPLHRFVYWASGQRRGIPETFDALKDISFDIPLGTSTGLVGVNGAGKSTLLKILTGTLEPTAGIVRLQGRVASLLELGTGFHPLFTGRQNIVYNARFLGLSREEIDERLPAIEAFSELGDFLHRPLRTYSSGMYVRLAFAVAASVSPDILIVDEVLAVGDAYFAQKCIGRIREFRDHGVTILFVSHDPGAVKTLCDRALLIHEGRITDDGTPAAVLGRYNALIASKTAESAYFAQERTVNRPPVRRAGTLGAMVIDVNLLNAEGDSTRAVVSGALATIRVRVLVLEEMSTPTVGILIRDRLGNDVFGTNTWNREVGVRQWHAGDTFEMDFHLPLQLGVGEFSITAAVHTVDTHVVHSYDWVDAALVFCVIAADDVRSTGVIALRLDVAIRAGQSGVSPGRVLAAALGPLPSAVHMGTDGSYLMREGWYAVEGSGTLAFRWTQRKSVIVLELSGSRLCLEARVDRPPGVPAVELRVICLGRALGSVILEPGDNWHEGTVPLPGDLPRGPSLLHLTVADAWRPADTGHGDDSRLLGVCVRRIWCE